MVRLVCLLACLLVLKACPAQNPRTTTPPVASSPAGNPPVSQAETGEFGQTDSGLLYPAHTMKRLQRMVDSLHLRFRVCEANRTYQSRRQGRVHYFCLEKSKVRKARADLAKQLSWEEIVRRYPKATTELNLPAVAYSYHSNDSTGIGVYTVPLAGNYSGREVELPRGSSMGDLRGGRWIVEYHSKSEYSDESVRAFYLLEDFQQALLPPAYARLVQYADCMIDTSTLVFRNLTRSRHNEAAHGPAVGALMAYVHTLTNFPKYPEDADSVAYSRYYNEQMRWDSTHAGQVAGVAGQPKFRQLLTAAVAEARQQGGSSAELEEYALRYLGAKAALDLKRGRRVVGFCSMDSSPRRHALEVAKLSAEAVDWETFLRAHLDIMNDRFDRMADGSYAWAGRKTYLHELELLDINVFDLLIGITLHIDNAGRYHYYGDLPRLGRALAETRNPGELEARLATMIADPGLDVYNRLRIYYLFRNYLRYVSDEAAHQRGLAVLNASVRKLPGHLAGRMEVKEQKEDQD